MTSATLDSILSTTLPPSAWREQERAHRERADDLTAEWRAVRARGETHPIQDFLFTYYSYPVRVLRRWHPGAGVELAEAAGTEWTERRWYVPGGTPGTLRVDAAALYAARAEEFDAMTALLERTLARQGQFSCFGLHEWAMVYRQPEHRHPVPLRLGQRGTDDVVDAHRVQCSHYDAYRFFTPEAAPLNALTPTRESQPAMEQPGCLHANMDLYKWAIKLGPLVDGALLLDAFALARDIRTVDMQASPYDVADWGAAPIAIETAEGKAEYVRHQRAFADRGNALRERLLTALRTARG